VKMECRPVALESLVEDIHRQATLLGQDRQIEVVLGTVMPAVVQGDELRLRELLLNLVENAVKYSHPNGKVEISLVTDGQQAVLSVSDQGIGIPTEDLPKIFNRFYRSDNARTHTKKGTGLGLAICAWIAESHRGRIHVQSHVGRGSVFTVTLPLAETIGLTRRNEPSAELRSPVHHG
ncbi:MAG: HAMP domain-containing histidine kinase, partial [Nitrospira sp.]|nr:HAMP domain-containing histidine kinase [Nitrospira sp.]